nr:type III-B CRISPR module RAMP protein Cmr6 [uncultured Undibacterium sp.]
MSHLSRIHADHLHANIEASHAVLGNDWSDYLALGRDLPALIRENGLRQTIYYLLHQSDKKPGCKRLLDDWLLNRSSCSLALSNLLKLPDYQLLTQIALAEAQRIKRSVEAIDQETPPDIENNEFRSPENKRRDQDLHLASLAEATHWFNVHASPLGEHIGLIWRFTGVPDRFRDEPHKQTYKTEHIDDVLKANKNWYGTPHHQLYKSAYSRWEKRSQAVSACCPVKVVSRLFIGMGSASVHETQVLLHPVYGLPYLPASTLKGVLRAWWQTRLDVMGPDHPQAGSTRNLMERLFGSEKNQDQNNDDHAGALVIHDGWWIPEAVAPLVREVETPHHSEYYTGQQDVPTAFDGPTPVTQLAVQGKFWLSVSHQNVGEAWAKEMLSCLCDALADPLRGGLGGKAFAAGYGRLVRVD